jgi:hypothetical protein
MVQAGTQGMRVVFGEMAHPLVCLKSTADPFQLCPPICRETVPNMGVATATSGNFAGLLRPIGAA